MIGEVLTAFVRSHVPWPPGEEVAAAPTDEMPELQVRAADVQASLTVLGRGGFAPPQVVLGRSRAPADEGCLSAVLVLPRTPKRVHHSRHERPRKGDQP
jgi:hypothetical protein